MKEAGYSTLYLMREMLILRSSSGWRSTSSTLRVNSGSSSRKSTPLCARLREAATASHGNSGDGVMWIAERSAGDESLLPTQFAGYGVYLGGFQTLTQ